MKATELIEKLQKIVAENGDVDILINHSLGWQPPSSIDLVEYLDKSKSVVIT